MAEEEFVEALDPVITTNTKKKARKKKVKKTVVEIEAPVDDQYIHASKASKAQKQRGSRPSQRRKSRSPSPLRMSTPSSLSNTSETPTAELESEEVDDVTENKPQQLASTKSEDEDEQFSDQERVESPEFPSPPLEQNDSKTPNPVLENSAKTPETPQNDNNKIKNKKPLSNFEKADFTVKITPEDALAKIKKDIAFVTREIHESLGPGEDSSTWDICLGEIDTLLTIVSLGFAESAQKVYDLSVAVNKMASENKRLAQDFSAAKARIDELEARPLPPLPEGDFAKLKECEVALAECLQVVRPGEIIDKSRKGTPQGEISASESIDRTLELSKKLVESCSDAMTTLSKSEMDLCQVKGDLRDAQESYFFSLALSVKQNLLSSNAAKGATLNSVPELFDMATRLKIPSSEWPKWISDNLVK